MEIVLKKVNSILIIYMSLFRIDTLKIGKANDLALAAKQAQSIQTLTPLICHFMTRYCNDKKRRRILCEIIQTEKSYVSSLEALLEVYYKPLDQSIVEKSGIIDTDSLNKLLGDFDQIYALHKNIILKTMETVYDDLQEPFPPHDAFLKVANAFIEIYPRMRQVYLTYLANNLQSEAILTKLKKNRKFRNFLDEALFNPAAKCQELDDFLILPTQRIASYRLLFERILKNFPTETHQKEHDQYTIALNQLIQIGTEMNSENNDQQVAKELLSVTEIIGKVPQGFVFMKPGRRFLGKFNCTEIVETDKKKSPKKCQIFVMNDVAIVTVRDEWSVFSATKYSFIEAVPLSQIHFRPYDFENSDQNKSFILISDGNEYPFIVEDSILRDNIVFKIKKLKRHIYDHASKMSECGLAYITKNMDAIHDSYFNPKKIMTRAEAIESLKI